MKLKTAHPENRDAIHGDRQPRPPPRFNTLDAVRIAPDDPAFTHGRANKLRRQAPPQ